MGSVIFFCELGLIDIREFKIQQRDDSKNLKKINRFNKRNNNFAYASLFLYFSLLFLYDVKLTNFTFYGEHK